MRIHSSLFRNLLKKLAGRIEPMTFIATTELLITSYMSTCIHNIFDCIDVLNGGRDERGMAETAACAAVFVPTLFIRFII
ncbi:hypothetical protein CUMW_221620 [Citrus unshiu]|uniref:Uncharacterized protein n=1 Tax=Citrus unshiu TaxID=55188 RepID=A0A2H5QEC9_CITUN|nr:hypothetical protein CUMW_221620 [Citrus unshiu]